MYFASHLLCFPFASSNPFASHLLTHLLHLPPFESSQLPSSSHLGFFSKPISFQKIPTKTQPLFASSSSSMSLQPIDELLPKLQEIIKLFQSVQEPKAKYEQLLFYGKNLNPLEKRGAEMLRRGFDLE
ncbi:hypothetical protein OIU84_012577 [Salix udensis]|uniref:Uncharacterized protein n=1 Tax=Salix udensis TaxID=889485 RepID=A0AAD6JFW8_9ROSI|nr:hypothetical protein OIU84_012577 [Salix udensis]